AARSSHGQRTRCTGSAWPLRRWRNLPGQGPLVSRARRAPTRTVDVHFHADSAQVRGHDSELPPPHQRSRDTTSPRAKNPPDRSPSSLASLPAGEERLHHVPVLWLPGDGVGKEVGDVLHHSCQAIPSLSVRNRLTNDDRHAVLSELAYGGQQGRSSAPGNDGGAGRHGNGMLPPGHPHSGTRKVTIRQQTHD